MPSSDEILAGLRAISNQGFPLAVWWHVAVASALGVVAAGLWRPSPRAMSGLLAAPLLSVSVFALAFGNPFNAAVFAGLAVMLVVLGGKSSPEEARPSGKWAGRLGIALVVFAWVYPHFLMGRSSVAYLIGAPLGLIPCPTLALLTGLSLLGAGPRGRTWSLVLAAAGLLYGAYGALRLGVWLDLGLLVGAGVLLDQAVGRRRRASDAGGLVSS